MEWLAQNWIWIVFGIGVLLLMTRARGCGMGRSSGRHGDGESRDAVPPAIGNRPGNLFDPVSRRSFSAGGIPISSVYQGRAYYFENRENRDAFEADPQKFLAGNDSLGEPVGTEHDHAQRRRHGC